jgi:hypothetical protein
MDKKKIFLQEINIMLGVLYWFNNVFHIADSMTNEFSENSKAQWSLYVPPVVTVCTTPSTFANSTFCPHTVFMCFVWLSEQTAIISLYSIN